MGNRYTNEGRHPRDLYDEDIRRGRDRGKGGFRQGRRPNDTANRSYPSFNDRSSYGGENYFGSGRQGYGDGIEDYQPNSTSGSSWRDSTGYSNYDYPERRYESTERRAGFGRDAYGLGYGGDWEPEANRRRYGRESNRPDRYERGYYRQSGYRSDYPSSERGFETERGDDRGWWDRASDEVSSWFGDEDAARRREMDERRSYRDRGPKNYTRSDDRIKEDINDRLTDYAYIDASEIDVQVANGEVVLTGTVETRYEKRMAEDVAEGVSGVRNVENRIRVDRYQTNTSDWNTGQTSTTNRADTNTTTDTATDQSRTATGRS